MERAVLAVIFGTFTLRLATGITGSMLVYYYAVFPQYGGQPVSAFEVGILGALFYASELIGSPIFGVLSDRIGHRKVMLIGPAFGGVAVVITALTVSLPIIGFTRLLEGASTAASVPSILGFIAFATAADELRRGNAVARFEAATLAGLMAGFVLGGVLFAALGPTAFFVNALVYLVSFLIYRHGVPPHAEPEPAARAHAPGEGLRRYWRILTGSHVWLLAPTWIAINATLGLFTSQTLFQLVRVRNPEFADQTLMGGFSPVQLSIGLAIGGLLFFVGLFYWGGKFKSMRRTTIILYGIAGGAVMLAAAMGINHAGTDILPLLLALLAIVAGGLFVLAGATPAAIGLLADMTEAYPNDRGAIMGLYSVFLGLGQIIGSILGGIAAEQAGLDGIFVVSFVLLGIALLPLSHLRRYEHRFGEPTGVAGAAGA
ncbi:MAG TPA: MFS transporter [Candidatus Limnocylindrales bacterium]|nr:MFS transporter [Candidatus Limnocylindrales bacterium]